MNITANGSAAQLALGCACVMLNLVVASWLQPYPDWKSDLLSTLCQSSLFGTLFSALLLRADFGGAAENIDESALGGLVIVLSSAPSAMVAALACSALRAAVGQLRQDGGQETKASKVVPHKAAVDNNAPIKPGNSGSAPKDQTLKGVSSANKSKAQLVAEVRRKQQELEAAKKQLHELQKSRAIGDDAEDNAATKIQAVQRGRACWAQRKTAAKPGKGKKRQRKKRGKGGMDEAERQDREEDEEKKEQEEVRIIELDERSTANGSRDDGDDGQWM